jgi:hypothetical protein
MRPYCGLSNAPAYADRGCGSDQCRVANALEDANPGDPQYVLPRPGGAPLEREALSGE